MNSIRLFVTTSQGSSSDHFIVRVFKSSFFSRIYNCSGLWMRLIECLLQFLHGIMRVDLRGGQTAMAQKIFDGIDFRTFIQQVRCISVS